MNALTYSIVIIAVMGLVNLGIRACPFLIFDRGGKVPKFVEYLGKALPPAIMSFLLLYCIRNINIFEGNHGLPDIICVAVAMILHTIKRNTFLSIGISTILYMLLVQLVF